MKYSLIIRQNLPFASCPAIVELDDERIATNNVVLPYDANPHNVRLFVIGNEYGALGAVWADCEQDAMDALCDEGFSAGLMVDDESSLSDEERDELTPLGNAGELHDLEHAWIAEVNMNDCTANFGLWLKFAEARGAHGVSNLSQV